MIAKQNYEEAVSLTLLTEVDVDFALLRDS
jgi:hypothetical protein